MSERLNRLMWSNSELTHTHLFFLENIHTYSVQEYMIGIHRTAVPNVKKQHEHDKITFNPVVVYSK